MKEKVLHKNPEFSPVLGCVGCVFAPFLTLPFLAILIQNPEILPQILLGAGLIALAILFLKIVIKEDTSLSDDQKLKRSTIENNENFLESPKENIQVLDAFFDLSKIQSSKDFFQAAKQYHYVYLDSNSDIDPTSMRKYLNRLIDYNKQKNVGNESLIAQRINSIDEKIKDNISLEKQINQKILKYKIDGKLAPKDLEEALSRLEFSKENFSKKKIELENKLKSIISLYDSLYSKFESLVDEEENYIILKNVNNLLEIDHINDNNEAESFELISSEIFLLNNNIKDVANIILEEKIEYLSPKVNSAEYISNLVNENENKFHID